MVTLAIKLTSKQLLTDVVTSYSDHKVATITLHCVWPR